MPTAQQKRQTELLKNSTRAIVHLRAQKERGRLGLIFGSGASKDLSFPDWNSLIRRLAAHADIDAEKILERFNRSSSDEGKDKSPAPTRSLASITQMLFNRYRSRTIATRGHSKPLTFLQEQAIKSAWIRILHDELYKDADPKARAKLASKHPYLNAFVPLIKEAQLTVNYNFDDTLEKLLLHSRQGDEKSRSRGYEAIDRPNAQFQRDSAIIYHPNGFLPSIFEDGTSGSVVFADDAFQDQLIHAATGKYVHLTNYLLSNTCLLIGLSLDDATLQSLLRQNAVSNPGNIHYVVHYREAGDADPEIEQAIFDANFESFNLFTLFLDKVGINDLAMLISKAGDAFELDHPTVTTKKFVYYVVGSVGAGKSTAASNFRSLLTYDEWIDERKPELSVPDDQVSGPEKEKMDAWIAEQFRKKNFSLNNSDEGIHLIDRCPLDPLTFGKPEVRKQKAQRLLKKITDDGKRPIAEGHILLLDCDVQDVMIRTSLKHKNWSEEAHRELLKNIEEVYNPLGVTKICTRGRDQLTVAKEIARVIHLEPYSPVNIGEQLEKHRGVGV